MASWHHELSRHSQLQVSWRHTPAWSEEPPPPTIGAPSHSCSYPLLPRDALGFLSGRSQEVGTQVCYDGKSETMITEHTCSVLTKAPVSGQVHSGLWEDPGKRKKEQEFTYKPTKPFCSKSLCLALSWRKSGHVPHTWEKGWSGHRPDWARGRSGGPGRENKRPIWCFLIFGWDMWDLSSPTKDWTCAPCSGSEES